MIFERKKRPSENQSSLKFIPLANTVNKLSSVLKAFNLLANVFGMKLQSHVART